MKDEFENILFDRDSLESIATKCEQLLDDGDESVAERILNELAKVSGIASARIIINSRVLRRENLTDKALSSLVRIGPPTFVAMSQKYSADRALDEELGSKVLIFVGNQHADALRSLLWDQSFILRNQSALALGKIRDIRAIPRLVELLADDFSREDAKIALLHEGPAAVDYLIRCLETNDRLSAARMLVHFGDDALQALIDSYTNDTTIECRVRIATIISKVSDSKALSKLISLLNHDSLRLRKAAAKALHLVGDPIATKSLLTALRGISSDEALIEAIDFTIRMFPTPDVLVLVDAINDPSAIVRGIAASGLQRSADEWVIDILADALLRETSDFVALRIVATFQQIGNNRALGTLETVANDSLKNNRIRKAAEFAYDAINHIEEDESSADSMLREFTDTAIDFTDTNWEGF